MKIVIRYTKFASNPSGDGGSKRSVQIAEFWRAKGVDFIEEKFLLPKKYTKLQAVRWCIRAIRFISKNVGWKKFPTLKDKINAIFAYALRLPAIYDKYKGQEIVFLWENTNDVAALYLMKAAGAKIIGYPHNLESLVPTQIDALSHKKAPFWLYEEIERLKLCDEVYAISKEETWLLQLFGVNAMYFPYFPPKVIEQELLVTKSKREAYHRNDTQEKSYLILGSATNPPTRMGMQTLIDYFGSKDNLSYTIHVAGYQSETLKYVQHPKIVYHGTMDACDLDAMQIQVDGIIINQPTTSGALTRIVENRLAGIPIYANFGAARDFYNLSDVHVYESFEDLERLLSK
jgi:hypothetical protein